jgi:Zn-dependent M28 family amino/carboxypeptidase
MKYRNLIKQLDNKLNYERLEIIIDWLDNKKVSYQKQGYSTGTNLIVDLGKRKKRIGVSSHFDTASSSAGANDNGSAIAVCLDIIEKFRTFGHDELGIRIFFFDEEETGLRGSTAYVRKHGLGDLHGLMNMELVGMGDKFALWPLDAKAKGQILETFERVAKMDKIESKRFDRIITNIADHVPFQKAGLKDCFTITAISSEDIEVSDHYYKALEFEVDHLTLYEILSRAPIFHHYHRPTDTYEKLSEESILMTSSAIWKTIVGVHKARE